MPAHVRGGDAAAGGIVSYPLDGLFEEVAFLAYHFHWPLDDILALEHADRERFIAEISAINRKMNDSAGTPSEGVPLQFWS